MEKKEHPKDVQFYSKHAMELLHSQKNKIKKFLQHRCIEYIGNGLFICKPIPGYNSSVYTLAKGPGDEFECNCQHFRKCRTSGDPAFCSHLGALYEFFKRGRKYE